MEEVFRVGIHLCANRISIFDQAVCVYVYLFLSKCFCDKANKEKSSTGLAERFAVIVLNRKGGI